MALARDLWTLDSPVDAEELRRAIEYVSDWIQANETYGIDERLAGVLNVIREIIALSHGFRSAGYAPIGTPF